MELEECPQKDESSKKFDSTRDDQVLEAIGIWGPWQAKMFFFISLFLIPGCFHILILTFINASQDFWCAPPTNFTISNLTEWLIMSGQHNSTSRCQIFDVDYSLIESVDWHSTLDYSPTKRVCTRWEYDTSIFKTSVVSEWDLVCENEHLKSVAQTIFFAGMLCGVTVAGMLSDTYGRKRVIVPLLLIMSVLGLASAHMPTFASFVAMRAICAVAFIGVFECIFTWVLESCGGKYLTIVGIGVEFFWVAGWLILALAAYLVREWRLLLTLVSLPGFAGVVLIWWMPESPKWLFSVGRIEEAEVIIRQAAAYNKLQLPPDWRLRPNETKAEINQKPSSILDLVRNRSLFLKSLIIFYNWFINSFCYYGLTLNANELSTNIHLSFTINGFLEIPAYGFALLVLLKTGRKYTYAVSMLSCGIVLLAIIGLPQNNPDWAWAVTTITILGKAFVTFSFATIYLYTAELYPTVLRTTGMGCSSFMARFGGMASSWVMILGRYNSQAPLITFGLSGVIAGALALFLPETHKKKLPDTIEESQDFKLGLVHC